jgi:hypothetical protein
MRPLLVVELNFLQKQLLSIRDRTNLVPFTEIRGTPLEIVEALLDLPLRLGRGFFGIDEPHIQASQGPLELDLSSRAKRRS